MQGRLRGAIGRWMRGDEFGLELRWSIMGCLLRLWNVELNVEAVDLPILLRRASVQNLRLAFSLFGSPAVQLSAEAVHVEICARPPHDSYWKEILLGRVEQERRKRLAAIDPEGVTERSKAENRGATGFIWSFLVRLFTTFILSAISIDLRDVKISFSSVSVPNRRACLSAPLMTFPQQGLRKSLFRGSLLASAAASVAFTCWSSPLKTTSSISQLSLSFEDTTASHAVLVMMLLMCFNFRRGSFTNMEMNVPETVFNLDFRELETLAVLISEFQGPQGTDHKDAGNRSPRDKSARELWIWAVSKVLRSSPLEVLSRTVQASLLRRRYASLYTQWLHQFEQGMKRKSLLDKVVELEKQLPVEAVALARRISRQKLRAMRLEREEMTGFWKLKLWYRPSGRATGGSKADSRWENIFSLNILRGSVLLACDDKMNKRSVGIRLKCSRLSVEYGATEQVLGYSVVCASLTAEVLTLRLERKQGTKKQRYLQGASRWEDRVLDRLTLLTGSGNETQQEESVFGDQVDAGVRATHLGLQHQVAEEWSRKSWKALGESSNLEELTPSSILPFIIAVYEKPAGFEDLRSSKAIFVVRKGEMFLSPPMLSQRGPIICALCKLQGYTLAAGGTNSASQTMSYSERISSYYDKLRSSQVSISPQTRIQVTAVATSLRVHLSSLSLGNSRNLGDAVLELENVQMALWPASTDCVTSKSGGLTSRMAYTTEKQRWLLQPPLPVLPNLGGFLDHDQIGHNFLASVSVALSLGDSAAEKMIEPAPVKLRASCCRDQFTSLLETFTATSMSASLAVASLVTDLRIEKMMALEQVASTYVSLAENIINNAPVAAGSSSQAEGNVRDNAHFALCISVAFEDIKACLGDKRSNDDVQLLIRSSWLNCVLGDELCSSICCGLQKVEVKTLPRESVTVKNMLTADHLSLTLADTSMMTGNTQRNDGAITNNMCCSLELDMGPVIMADCPSNNLVKKARSCQSVSENCRGFFALEKSMRTCLLEVEGGFVIIQPSVLVDIVKLGKRYAEASSRIRSSHEPDYNKPNVHRSYSSLKTATPNRQVVRSQSDPQNLVEDNPESHLGCVLSSRVSGISFGFTTSNSSEKYAGGVLLHLSGTSSIEFQNSSEKILIDITQFSVATLQSRSCGDLSRLPMHRIPQFGVKESPQKRESLDDTSSASTSTSSSEPRTEYMIECMTLSVNLKKDLVTEPLCSDCWQGRISVYGLDAVALTTYEVQVLLTMYGHLCEMPSAAKQVAQKRAWNDLEAAVRFELPDGAIVSIKDAEEHLYLCVEESSVSEGQYHLGGAWHYSIVGQRALFQVKYQDGSRGGENSPWFSLISLHAKNTNGVQLRVHYRPGSRQLEMSSSNDGSWELWQWIPHRFDRSSEFDVHSGILGNLVHLINHKSKQGIGFVDGVPAFVRHPGNALKVQVLSQGSTCGPVLKAIPSVKLEVGDGSLTLLHAAAGAVHLLPLVRIRTEGVDGLLQSSSQKTRLFAGCSFVLEHFEVQSNSWLHILHPVATDVLWISRTGIAAESHRKVPSSLFCRLKKVDAVLSELSLDACLFLVGVMEWAGPFTVNYSPVLVNRCQIENQTGVNLLCRFDRETGGGEEDKVPAWESSSFLMRHVTSRRGITPAELSTSVTINLEKPGKALSSPVVLSLGEPGVLAVRTRLEAFEGSRANAPGPIVVIDISKRSQDGVYLTVSPMVKIQNATGLSLQLRCRRPIQGDDKGATVTLKNTDTIDDSMGSFDALSLEGEMRKALISFNVGNFLLSVRPESSEGIPFEWSEDIKGAMAVRVFGLFDKLHYGLKRTLKGKSFEYTFGSVSCKTAKDSQEGAHHFLIRTARRQVPVTKVSNEHKRSLVAWQEQQDITILPTLRVSNFLSSEIHVQVTASYDAKLLNPVKIPGGGRRYLFVDLSALFFIIKDEENGLVSDPIDISIGHKRFQELAKKGGRIKDLEIEVKFSGGTHVALLKVYRAEDGVLELSIFTKYVLRNESGLPLVLCAGKRRSKWGGSRNLQWPAFASTNTLLPHTEMSWLQRSSNLLLRREGKGARPAALELDSLSGTLEISLGVETATYVDKAQLGVSLQVPYQVSSPPSNIVIFLARYIVVNEFSRPICVCQSGLEDDEHKLDVDPGSNVAVHAQESPVSEGNEESHSSSLLLRFRLQEGSWKWSGRVCAASLGSFFLKLRGEDGNAAQYAIVNIEESAASLLIKFRLRATEALPYRIENKLPSGSISYHQLGVMESETLVPNNSVDYVWDDLSLQHRLVVTLSGSQACSEVNLDKVKAWKSFAAVHRNKGFSLQLPFQAQLGISGPNSDRDQPDELLEKGYEVYADGPTRVLRICEKASSTKKSYWQSDMSVSQQKVELKVPLFRICMVESVKQKIEDLTGEDLAGHSSPFSPFLSAPLTSVSIEVLSTQDFTFCQMKVQGLSVDIKWNGAPFASMLRIHDQDRLTKSTTALHAGFVLSNAATNPIQMKYCSILLQAFDLNVDEDTLLKIVPFSRTSLSTSTSSLQIYFERFEIHPIKIVASFMPGRPRVDYTSTQETFRALLHTVIKLPSVKRATVELNGVLLSHALLTFRQLVMKCVQHYSWYVMRAIYIARGTKLLPPGFASLFDDSAASSLDVFFDPSSGSIDLQGLTLGMFNLLSRGLRKKGQGGTSRYLGDFEKTMKKAGSNIAFAVVTELSDNILKGAEANGIDGMVNGFRRGILNVAMEPLVLQKAVVRGGSTRRIQLDRSVGTDEAYIEGYLQATLDAVFKQDYLKVKVMEDQVVLKNLPPNTMLMNEIVNCVKNFLIGEGLLAGEAPTGVARLMRLPRGEQERRLFPAVISLSEQLLVIFAIRGLRRYTRDVFHIPGTFGRISRTEAAAAAAAPAVDAQTSPAEKPSLKRTISNFFISSAVAYIDGRLCRHIPNELARRIVSGFLLSFVE